MKAFLFTLLFVGTLFSGCIQEPATTSPSTPNPLPAPTPVAPVPNQSGSGRMTNQPLSEIPNASVNLEALPNRQELLGHVKQAIISSYRNWVVFKHGTYIIFDSIEGITDVQAEAVRLLTQHKPKRPADKNWDFKITELNNTVGWSVFGNGYGIYTYIHPLEVSMHPNPQELGAYGKAKRALDEANPEIIFISSDDGIKEL